MRKSRDTRHQPATDTSQTPASQPNAPILTDTSTAPDAASRQTIGLGWFAGRHLTPEQRREKLRAMGYDAPEPDTPLTTEGGQADRQGGVTLGSAAAGSLAAEASADPPREESQAAATRRWRATGIADQVAVYRDRMREEYRAAHPKAKRREAHEYAWACALAAFPRPGVEPQSLEEEPEVLGIPEPAPEPEAAIAADKPAADSLVFTAPESWGELPDNATLQAEIAWVSANRLRVRDGSGVDLSRAKTPAPSYSALSWLETSILFPSKFADISVKATANQDDEKEAIRREKASIEEIRSILKEMLED